MADIRLNSRKLYDAARRLRRIKGHMDEQKNQLHQVQSEVQEHWISDSRGTYLDGLDQSEGNLRRLSSKTEELARRLENLARTAAKIERENAASFRGSGGGSGGGGGGSR